ncbi:eukaryotic translation initiation factor 3 subunit E isoform X2 [Octopus bimaculoides]|uniref:Eukaryotic translation initiation factor 3 subunit E n=1 Tax=Octopus bimaculoides TaxID=37653 RepID=A0A0L8GX38_OCTBM|nr:eukaryotic translation initiation factor 3 subunit E isoform X2 [Octopus bimaculoides]|eukprot:XP_014777263.1 PREDICTED: eukaryotic translation initiation factor 3 subunit E-like isoform X2 [Octopus bimaculoides]
MAVFDLTNRLSQYFDRHLILPFMEFLSDNNVYDNKELIRGKLEIISKTKMARYAITLHHDLYPLQDIPKSYHENLNRVLAEDKKLKERVEKIAEVMNDPEVMKTISNFRDGSQLYEYLTTRHDISKNITEDMYNYAKFQFECGNYEFTSQYLYFVRILLPTNDKFYLNTLWGILASEILLQNFDAALEELNRLREYIDTNAAFWPALQTLQQRTWFVHWSLFVFFNNLDGLDLLVDLFLYQPPYLNTIQTVCPHILRYLTTAVIINKSRRRSVLKDLVKVIQQESYSYRDPITEFIECLYVNFDFDGAQHKLLECESVLCYDFFLSNLVNEFIENARLLIFEIFCRIHECISINMLSQKLNMTPDAAEQWIVNLIRHARLDAKIDSKLGHVVMGTKAVSPYQQVIEKTKNLNSRSHFLALNIHKKLGLKIPESSTQWGQDYY